MTPSTDGSLALDKPGGPLGPVWREAAERTQRDVLAQGATVVTCSAPLGAGGLGRHLSEILDAVERGGRPPQNVSGWSPPLSRALGRLRIPVSPGMRTRLFMGEFDVHAARLLPQSEHLIAFNGQALKQFAAARRKGYDSLALVSANSHLRQVARRHELAHRRYPLEGSWTRFMLERNLAEYARADRIYVASHYVRESFLAEGVAEELLFDFPLTPAPRFQPEGRHAGVGEGAGSGSASEADSGVAPDAASGRFEVVYVGSLAVHKGVPLLIDAIRRLPHADLRLTLVGGWGSRGMRRFVQSACAADPRLEVRAGDPLPYLRRARLCVHPAYEDGFAYAPAEALACGVPVIVSEDTGMKELIGSAAMGLTVPTDDLDALSQAIDAAYRRELLDR
ncbi:MAG TPA: glycosyltransferase family 4 protein [Solirubrobacteraceae bacterium]|jgi:glycosyltransferase involved in cell wall biosynthesis|nr:glycosyltransferase family 4 protein [Solirubrobacteraceae bacterium]